MFWSYGTVKLFQDNTVAAYELLSVFVGVGSTALLSGEPFGLREAIGTLLVLSAAVVEIGVYAPLTWKS